MSYKAKNRAACWIGLGPLPLLAFASVVQAQEAPQPQAVSPPQSIGSVTVTSTHLPVQTLIDRKVYDVTQDVQSTFGTVGDVLSAIPSVDVDGDGVVTLRGDTHVLILVDGKPSALFTGANAGENLQSIPAGDIERIEVLTDPPPEYKAEGAAGVINIILRKKRAQGTSGSAQASAGAEGRYQFGGGLDYGNGPLTLSFSASYRHDLRPRLQVSDLIAPDPVTGLLVDNRSSMDELAHRDVPQAALSAGYELNDRQSLSLDLSRTGRGGQRTYTQLNTATVPDGALTQSGERLSWGHDGESDYDVKAGFTQKLDREGESLALTAHRSWSHNIEGYDYTNESSIPPAATYYSDLGFSEDNSQTEFDADYVLPLRGPGTSSGGDAGMLKAGYGYEQDDYAYGAGGGTFDPLSGAQTPDPAQADQFRYRQAIQSWYGSWKAAAGPWDWQLGARAEYTRTDGRQLTQDLVHAYDYLRLYPSAHLERSVGDHSTLSLGASRRISRSDADAFNPYVDEEYTPNLRSGNPLLLPQYTQSYQAGYGYDLQDTSYSVTAYYRHNTDSATTVTENLGNGVSLTTAVNLPRNDSSGVEFATSMRPFKPLSVTLSGNAFHSQIDASALGFPGLRTTTGINGKLKLDYHPVPAGTAQLLVTRTDKVLTPEGYVGAIDIVNAGYRHQLTRHLTATITVSDFFDGQKLQRVAATPAFTQLYLREIRGRVVWVGAVYAFGASGDDKGAKFEYDQ